ncbi:MAG TPA: WD40 repeat domain-containing protein [Opitutaceae bacterium]|nr:WD40 repeat domain-containing protein [Opitutaceae bacterium]
MQLTKHWAGQLDDYAIDLAWSPEGALLAAASAAGPVSLFAAADGARRADLPGHDDGTNCLAWQPQARGPRSEENPPPSLSPLASRLSPSLLATGGQDGTVKFWDAAAGQHTATAALGASWVEHLAWVGGTARLLFAAAGKNLFALRADASIAHTFKPASKTLTALAAHPTGGAIAAAYFGGVGLWDADDFVAQKEYPYANGIHALAWSPDGRWLVSGNQDPSVHLWIPETDTELHMSGYEGKVKFLSFDHTSRWLATSGGRDACIWDCSGGGPEGREPAMLPHAAPVCAVKFQNAHGLLATAAQDGVVQLWSPERRMPLRATVKMPAAATKLAWSPDDRLLAIGSEKGAVYVLKCEA